MPASFGELTTVLKFKWKLFAWGKLEKSLLLWRAIKMRNDLTKS
jgi:hypothetical protein